MGVKNKTSVEFFGRVQAELAQNPSSKLYPGSIMDGVLSGMDYAQMGTLMSECHEYYQYSPIHIIADGENAFETLVAEAMLNVLEVFGVLHDSKCEEGGETYRYHWDIPRMDAMIDMIGKGVYPEDDEWDIDEFPEDD